MVSSHFTQNRFCVPAIQPAELPNHLLDVLDQCEPFMKGVALTGLAAIVYAGEENPDLLRVSITNGRAGSMLGTDFQDRLAISQQVRFRRYEFAIIGASVVSLAVAATSMLKSAKTQNTSYTYNEYGQSITTRMAELPITNSQAQITAGQMIDREPVEAIAIRFQEQPQVPPIQLSASHASHPFFGASSRFITLTTIQSSYPQQSPESTTIAEATLQAGDTRGTFGSFQFTRFTDLIDFTKMITYAVNGQ